MPKHFLPIAIFSIISISCYSQNTFENGYFIDNENLKVDCLIKNVDRKKKPTEFEYKLQETSEVKKGNVQTVKEFGINNTIKYIKALVKIDRSKDDFSNANDVSTSRAPVFQEESIFLKVLVEGKVSLYVYEDNDLEKFFYKTADSEIKQLIHKHYLEKDDIIATNNDFRQQLYLDLNCQSIKENDYKFLKYTLVDLEDLFIKFNKCNNSNYTQFKQKQKKELLNLTIKPRLDYRSLLIQSKVSKTLNTDFGSKFLLNIGVEAEFIIPFNKNKWSIIIDPSYERFKSKKTIVVDYSPEIIYLVSVNFQSIELPIGIRHSFFLNTNSKVFIEASCVFDFSSNSVVTYTDNLTLNTLDIKPKKSLALGIGYKFKNRYSLELRYLTKHEILKNYTYWSSEYKSFSIIFGYTLF